MLQSSASSGNPLQLTELCTEYNTGEYSNLLSFYRGGGWVANHQRNEGIVTSGTINLLSFLGTEKDFTSDAYTSCASQATYCGIYYWESPYADVIKLQYQPYGAVQGSIARIGTSKSSTSQALFAELSDYYDEYGNYGYFRVYGSGNTGTWWSSITLYDGGTPTNTLYRTDSHTPAGINNGSFALWYWDADYFYFNGSTNYTFKITLS